jgi:hypothetical protein
MHEKRVEFKLKGQRNYVHGTDIFNSVMEYVIESHGNNQISDIAISFHAEVRTGLILEFCTQSSFTRPKDASVIFGYKYHGLHNWIVLRADGHVISNRNPYDEDVISNACVVNENASAITREMEPSFSLIEVIVSMNKRLHHHLFPKVKKWLFVKAEFLEWRVDQPRLLQIQIVSNFNQKLTKSAVLLDGKHLGFLYFAPKDIL